MSSANHVKQRKRLAKREARNPIQAQTANSRSTTNHPWDTATKASSTKPARKGKNNATVRTTMESKKFLIKGCKLTGNLQHYKSCSCHGSWLHSSSYSRLTRLHQCSIKRHRIFPLSSKNLSSLGKVRKLERLPHGRVQFLTRRSLTTIATASTTFSNNYCTQNTKLPLLWLCQLKKHSFSCRSSPQASLASGNYFVLVFCRNPGRLVNVWFRYVNFDRVLFTHLLNT